VRCWVLVTWCAACGGSAFSAEREAQDAATVSDSGTATEAALATDAPTNDRAAVDGMSASSGRDASAIQEATTDACGPVTSTYYSVANCVTTQADAANGYALPGTYVMQIGAGINCDGMNTPAVCQCAGAYTCECMMPALLAAQAKQTGSDIFCAQTISDCTVDALGVVHVSCG
jgi:hypothetical protein